MTHLTSALQRKTKLNITHEAKPIILKSVVEWNIAQIKDILKHPEHWGSGTKEDWERHLREQEKLLEASS